MTNALSAVPASSHRRRPASPRRGTRMCGVWEWVRVQTTPPDLVPTHAVNEASRLSPFAYRASSVLVPSSAPKLRLRPRQAVCLSRRWRSSRGSRPSEHGEVESTTRIQNYSTEARPERTAERSHVSRTELVAVHARARPLRITLRGPCRPSQSSRLGRPARTPRRASLFQGSSAPGGT